MAAVDCCNGKDYQQHHAHPNSKLANQSIVVYGELANDHPDNQREYHAEDNLRDDHICRYLESRG
jgi:hypothetical protein